MRAGKTVGTADGPAAKGTGRPSTGIVTAAGSSNPGSERPGNPLEFETLIADLSSRFVNLPPAEVDREIEAALRRVCEFLDLDLAVLWQRSLAAPAVLLPTHVHYAQEDLGPPEPLRQEQFPWFLDQLLAGRLVTISSPEDFPAEAAVDRESCRQIGVRSNLTLPLLVGGGQPIGVLGLNTLREHRDWPEALVNRLQLVAQVFTNALARKRHDLSLQESEARLALAADSAGAGLWTLDFGTGVFWVTEKARAIFGYSPEEAVDFPRLGASVHPEDLARVAQEVDHRAGVGRRVPVVGHDEGLAEVTAGEHRLQLARIRVGRRRQRVGGGSGEGRKGREAGEEPAAESVRQGACHGCPDLRCCGVDCVRPNPRPQRRRDV